MGLSVFLPMVKHPVLREALRRRSVGKLDHLVPAGQRDHLPPGFQWKRRGWNPESREPVHHHRPASSHLDHGPPLATWTNRNSGGCTGNGCSSGAGRVRDGIGGDGGSAEAISISGQFNDVAQNWQVSVGDRSAGIAALSARSHGPDAELFLIEENIPEQRAGQAERSA